ncbi:hypothetical protein CRU99_09115 [Malaciobacter mytili]|uniref:hypothetical protein n=1 Tax=Malaciobacter mytili TaxID=603050 RepID=UPI00100BB560|nr:hypothetical protein [Malaciobacter mytili]RXI42379.1 hypothetical protein CRU99_09115 [Malaciobacter mytili]
MEDKQIPLELISTGVSIFIVFAIFFKIFQYKQKLDVLKELDRLKDENQLTQKDKDFIKTNLKDYKEQYLRKEGLVRLITPIFITIAAFLFLLFDFQETLIHLNILIVAYIYLQINRLHTRNFTKFLEELDS